MRAFGGTFWVLFVAITLVWTACEDDNGTEPCTDSEPPTVAIVSPDTAIFTCGTVDITVEATDNQEISKVELFVDGILRYEDTSSPYVFSVDFSAYSEGVHRVAAQAHDGCHNSAVSDTLIITHRWDFWPEGDGAIRVTLSRYEEEDGFVHDDGSCGDPFFTMFFSENPIDLDTIRIPETGNWEDTCSLDDFYVYAWDVPDSLKQFMVGVNAFDYDSPDSTAHIDCWSGPEYGGYGVILNTETTVFPCTLASNGAVDGIPDEADAYIRYVVELIEVDW